MRKQYPLALGMAGLVCLVLLSSIPSASALVLLDGWVLPAKDSFIVKNVGTESAVVVMAGYYMPDKTMHWDDIPDFVLVLNDSKVLAIPAQYRQALRIVVLDSYGNSYPIKMRPTADFSLSTNGAVIQFTDLSGDEDGWVVSWFWKFGDNTTSTARNPTHTYSVPGTYSVSLTVTDDDGLTDNVTKGVAAPYFNMDVNPSSGSVNAGSSTTAIVTVTSHNSFSGSVGLSALDLPAGASASFDPTSVTLAENGTATSGLTLFTSPSTPAGTYLVAITGNGGGWENTTTYSLTVTGGGTTTTTTTTQGGGGTTTTTTTTQGGGGGYAFTFYVKDATTGNGISGATVTVTGGPTLTTNSSGVATWSSYQINCTKTVTVSKSGYQCDWWGTVRDYAQRDIYFPTGDSGAVFFLSNIGWITGLTPLEDTLTFSSVNQTKFTTMSISGNYARTINVSYDVTDVCGVYRGWATGTVPSAPSSYTFNGKSLKWNPPSPVMFHPGVMGAAYVADCAGAGTSQPSRESTVTFRESTY